MRKGCDGTVYACHALLGHCNMQYACFIYHNEGTIRTATAHKGLLHVSMSNVTHTAPYKMYTLTESMDTYY